MGIVSPEICGTGLGHLTLTPNPANTLTKAMGRSMMLRPICRRVDSVVDVMKHMPYNFN